MIDETKLYTNPAAISPLKPSLPLPKKLNDLAIEVMKGAAGLAKSLHGVTAAAIANFLRPANSYYSNLIEGHDTHPLAIAQALHNEYQTGTKNHALQVEAIAHIAVHQELRQLLAEHSNNPYTAAFWKSLHFAFYQHLPEDFRFVESYEGKLLEVLPGEIRTTNVRVGAHIAPAFEAIEGFTTLMESIYKPSYEHDRFARIVQIGAAHHRLAWVHPFLDGNGRVMRLFSDAAFIAEELDANGLWSMSRGLARHEREYKEKLTLADAQRQGDGDGRGNLSESNLIMFCEFFLRVALDQIEYMTRVLAIDDMLGRLKSLVELMRIKEKWRPESYYILEAVFLKGSIAREEVIRLTGLSDKTAKAIARNLIKVGLLATNEANNRDPYRAAYSIQYAPMLFPGLYPASKEADIVRVGMRTTETR
ncbi:Fic family protein [Hymenobacter sp. UYP22]|uniref:Fic family protein n=1 Tax=Hymenobacter sp. UYP22 TaxID=3156348 RepID=UPI003394A2F5